MSPLDITQGMQKLAETIKAELAATQGQVDKQRTAMQRGIAAFNALHETTMTLDQGWMLLHMIGIACSVIGAPSLIAQAIPEWQVTRRGRAMNLHWPQIVWIIYALLFLVVSMTKHGEPRNTKWNGGTALASLLISGWLLWCGGFFTGGAS